MSYLLSQDRVDPLVMEGNVSGSPLIPDPIIKDEANVGEPSPTILAQAIDAAFAAQRAVEEEIAIYSSKRKLAFNLDVTPEDEEWQAFQGLMCEELSTNRSVESIMKDHFEEGQQLVFIPPLTSGIILNIQEDSANEYRQLLASGGRLHGQPDNLLTKLTMLHFGLPVAPLTMQNLFRRMKHPNEDDPPDDPAPEPSIRRIEFSENALDFLDVYNERAYGYKILRRAKPSEPVSRGPKVDWTKFAKQQSKITKPRVGAVRATRMRHRGGDGRESLQSDDEKDQGYIYNLLFGRLIVGHDVESFVTQALKLLDIDPRTEWKFMVQQYDNRGEYKTQAYNVKHQAGPGATTTVTKKDTSAWDRYIRPLVMNRNDDWAMVVYIPRTSSNAPEEVSLNHQSEAFSKVKETRALEKIGFQDHRQPKRALNTPKGSMTTVRFFVRKEPLNIPLSHSGINAEGILDIILEALGLEQVSRYKIAIDVYKSNSRGGGLVYDSTSGFSDKSPEEAFNNFYHEATELIGHGKVYNVRLASEPRNDDWTTGSKADKNPIVNVWGFSGTVKNLQDELEIWAAIEQLLGEQLKNEKSVFISPFDQERAAALHDVEVTADSFKEFFGTISEYASDQEVNMFVSLEELDFGAWKPRPDESDIVYLTRGHVVSYWKLPKDLDSVDYGINQLQTDFRRAMSVHFPDWSEPSSRQIVIGDVNIGYGVADLTFRLLKKVKEDYSELQNDLVEERGHLEYHITFAGAAWPNSIGVTLIGSSRIAEAPRNDFRIIANRINGLSVEFVDRSAPSQFKIWKTAQEREWEDEEEDLGSLLSYGSDPVQVSALKDWFNSTETPTGNIVFRPDWATIKVESVDDPAASIVVWDCEEDATLKGFREVLQQLFNEQDLVDADVQIIEPTGPRSFVLDDQVDEFEFKLFIFDWFHTSRIQVKLIHPTRYALSKNSLFGFSEEKVSQLLTENEKTAEPIPPDTFRPISGNARLPRDRVILEDVVQRKFAPEWNAWVDNNNVQDKLQRSTYIRDQPIFNPGRAPADPIFGVTAELPIGVNDQTPTVFGTHLTLTDIAKLKDENRKLRNHVLEREKICSICNSTFEAFQTEEIAAHYIEHQNALKSAGDCVLCGDMRWKFMTADQKRSHLFHHQAQDEGEIANDIWRGFECPGCDADLSKYKSTEKILEHVIAHDPLTIKFCDRCSRSYKHLSQRDLEHHRHTCSDARQKGVDELDWEFCVHCGQNMSEFSVEMSEAHDETCDTSTDRTHCTQCGWETTVMSEESFIAHQDSCKPPGGEVGTYCKRCGEERVGAATDDPNSQHHRCKSARYYENSMFSQLKVREDQLNHREHKLKLEQKQLAADQRSHIRKSTYLTRNLDVLRSIENLNEEQRLYLDVETFEEQADIHYEPIDRCPFPNCDENLDNLNRIDVVKHIKAHLDADDENVTMFDCPLVIEDGGYSAICGERLSLADGGSHLKRHYIHQDNWEEDTAVGRNIRRFKRRRKEMEEETEHWRRVAKKSQKKTRKDADNAKSKSNDKGVPEWIDLEAEGDSDSGNDKVISLDDESNAPSATGRSATGNPFVDSQPEASSGTMQEDEGQSLTSILTKTPVKSKSKAKATTQESSDRRMRSKRPRKSKVKPSLTYLDGDDEFHYASPTPSTSDASSDDQNPTALGSAPKKGLHRNFKGSKLTDASFRPNRNEDGDVEDEPDSAKVAEELARNPLAVTSPGKRPAPGRRDRDGTGKKVKISLANQSTEPIDNSTAPAAIETLISRQSISGLTSPPLRPDEVLKLGINKSDPRYKHSVAYWDLFSEERRKRESHSSSAATSPFQPRAPPPTPARLSHTFRRASQAGNEVLKGGLPLPSNLTTSNFTDRISYKPPASKLPSEGSPSVRKSSVRFEGDVVGKELTDSSPMVTAETKRSVKKAKRRAKKKAK